MHSHNLMHSTTSAKSNITPPIWGGSCGILNQLDRRLPRARCGGYVVLSGVTRLPDSRGLDREADAKPISRDLVLRLRKLIIYILYVVLKFSQNSFSKNPSWLTKRATRSFTPPGHGIRVNCNNNERIHLA